MLMIEEGRRFTCVRLMSGVSIEKSLTIGSVWRRVCACSFNLSFEETQNH